MQWIAGAYCIGVLLASQLPVLPVTLCTGLFCLSLLFLLFNRIDFRYRLCICACLLGALHLQYIANKHHSKVTKLTLPDVVQVSKGEIISLPDCNQVACRYVIRVIDTPQRGVENARILIRHTLETAAEFSEGQAIDSAIPRVGEFWSMTIRPRVIQGLHNPTGFDRERYQFARQIHATAYVGASEARRLNRAEARPVDRMRSHLSDRLNQWVDEADAAAVMQALLVGDQRNIPDSLWQSFRVTGTLHLMAISGLHIGLIAGLGFLLARVCYRHTAVARRFSRKRLGMAIALALAFIYAMLAGFTVPTQRALIMLMIAGLALLTSRAARPGLVILWSVTLVILVDPRQVLMTGFWYSFIAVAALLFAFNSNLHWRQNRSRLLLAQGVIMLALYPLALVYGQPASGIAPWINLLVIPVLGFLIMPLLFIGVALASLLNTMGIHDNVAAMMMMPAASMTSALMGFIESVSRLTSESLTVVNTTLNIVMLTLAALLMLGPAIKRLRVVGSALILLSVMPARQLPESVVEMQVLDVGQGLSVAIHTRHSTGIYDFGASAVSWQQSESDEPWSMGNLVINPYLRLTAVDTNLDYLIVSHRDNDHSGGLAGVLRQFSSSRLLVSGQRHSHEEDCRAGMSWQRDGVSFEVLHPGSGLPYVGNNSSCVLLIEVHGHRILLPGDIESVVESALVRDYAERLEGLAVLLVPHHGSKTSSSPEFTALTSPEIAVVSSRLNNRFGFPDARVKSRYLAEHSVFVNTASCGAIRIRVDESGAEIIHTSRQARPRIWHNPRNQERCQFTN